MAAGVRTLVVKFVGDASGLTSASKTAQTQLEKGKQSFGKLNKAAVFTSGLVVGAFGLWAKGAIAAAEEGVAAEKKLTNVFEQMGGTGTETFAQLGDAAKSIGKDIAQPATEITKVQTKLGTFGKVWEDPIKGAENFNRATVLAFDLEAAGFGTADSNVTQLGKALQDPTKGMTALARAGVSFTDAEKEKIKQLQESGNLLGAQEIVYQALEEQVGGTAAAGVTDSERMRVAIGELSESFGRVLLPAVKSVSEWVQKLTGWMEENKTTVAIIAGVVVGLAAAILAVNVAVKIWRAAVVVATAAQWLWNIAMSANPMGLIIIVIAAVVAAIVLLIIHWDTVKKVALLVWDKIWGGIKKVWEWIKKNWPLLLAIITGPIGLAVLFVVRNFDKIKAGAGRVKDFIAGIPGRIKSAFSRLGEIITAPFRAGFEAVKQIWNRTIGGKGFDIPSWVPLVGGKSFRFPRFHSGGVVPGPLGREVPILARAGERVLTREQDLAGGGDTNVTVIIDGRAIDESLVRVVRSRDRGLKRRVRAGSGAFA
jgi:hypothetical protein